MTKKEQIQNQPPLVYRASHLTLDKIMNTQNSRHVKLFQSKVKMYVSKITPNISELLFSLWYPLLTHYRVNIPGKAGVFPSHTRKSVPGWCRQADNINKLHCCQPALWLEVLTRLTSSAPLRAGLSPPESLAFFLTYEDPTHTHTHTHTQQLLACNRCLIDILSTVFTLPEPAVTQVIGAITLNDEGGRGRRAVPGPDICV